MSYNKVVLSGINTSQLVVLKESEKIKLLEEIQRTGSKEAKDKLIQGNLRLVLSVIQKFTGRGEDIDDLFQIGVIGLIKAINSFNPDKGIRLATYAAKCIDNELLMMLRAERKTSREVSLYEPVGKDKEGNEISIIETVSCEPVDIVADMVFNQRVDVIEKSIDSVLSEREAYIIRHRFGLMGNEELTQSQIADNLGISRSYVSRIEKKSLEKLKKVLEDNGL